MLAIGFCLALAAEPLGFAEALARAEQTPALEASRRAVEKRSALADSVSILPANPMLMVQPGVRQIRGGAAQPEVYVSVTQDFNLAGYGAKRRGSAISEATSERAALLSALHQQRLAAAAAWLAAWTAQGTLAMAEEELTLAAEWAARVNRAAASGGLTKVDASLAATYRAEAHLAVLTSEGEAFNRGVELNRSLSLQAREPAKVQDALPEIAELQDGKLATHTQAPALRLAEATMSAEGARLREVEAMHGTGLQIGALGWREGGGDLAAVLTLQLTLPLFERSQRERSVQIASVEHQDARVTAARVETQAAQITAAHELEHTAATLAAIRDELVPAAQLTVEGLSRRFDLGDATAQELIIARRALVAAKSRLIRARAEAVLARFYAQELVRASERSAP